jgi:hypothetical protein
VAINVWRRFGDLLKPPSEEVVTITLVNGDGTVTATTLTGQSVRLRCALDLTAGDKAFAAAGEVRGAAPSLTYHELEV